MLSHSRRPSVHLTLTPLRRPGNWLDLSVTAWAATTAPGCNKNAGIAPSGSPDSPVNAGDLLVCLQIVLNLKVPTNGELAHADLYPVGAPDGIIGLPDFIQLQKLLFSP